VETWSASRRSASASPTENATLPRIRINELASIAPSTGASFVNGAQLSVGNGFRVA
jgi:hypothetical protein